MTTKKRNTTCFQTLLLYYLESWNCFTIFAVPNKEKTYRGVEQLVARWAHNPKVIGSSPIAATKKKDRKQFRSFFVYIGC